MKYLSIADVINASIDVQTVQDEQIQKIQGKVDVIEKTLYSPNFSSFGMLKRIFLRARTFLFIIKILTLFC